jgi:hypothetical protein
MVGALWHFDSDAPELSGKTVLIHAGNLDGPGTHELAEVDHTFQGEEAWDNAGYKTVGAGDTNGDGMPDLLFSAWQGHRLDETEKIYLLLSPD